MSDETYYTVLSVKETASPLEIKTAYRDLIKQVHPDTITNLAPYLRRIAEDKAKEITEAYTVLSNSSKRREYDRQLAAYRRQNAPQAPPSPPPTTPRSTQHAASTSSGPYCNRCGTPLYVGGLCPTCNKFTTPVAAPPAKTVRWLGYNWAPLIRWTREHPMLTATMTVLAIFCFSIFYSESNVPQQVESKTPVFTNHAEAASKGDYSEYPCDFHDKVSSIDGKPCKELQDTSVPAPPPRVTVDAEPTTPQASSATNGVSGVYAGTVHNQTVNLSSSFNVKILRPGAGALGGCVEIKPPLVGSGALRGSIRGTRVNFVVSDIAFQGTASKNVITGTYVVSRPDGQQLGDFRLTKQPSADGSYSCGADGTLTVVEPSSRQYSDVPSGSTILPRVAKPHLSLYAVVNAGGDSTLYKRCAFLPMENAGRCDFGPEEVAELKQGDRVKVLSPLTRAQSGDDIYKVRTQQGWEGWIKAEGITLESQ